MECEKLCERLNELEERVHKLEHTTTKKGETEVMSDKLDKLLAQNIDLAKDLKEINNRYIANSLMLESLVVNQKNTIAYKNFLHTPIGKGLLIVVTFILTISIWFILSILSEDVSNFVVENVIVIMSTNFVVAVSSVLFSFKKQK